MSAPSASGRCSKGVAKTLSTTSTPPARWVSVATAAMSMSSSVGLDGLSQNAAVDQLGDDAVTRQDLRDDVVAGIEQRARRDHAVAGFDLAGERGEHRGHAARRGAAGFRALEEAQPLLEHGDGRIGIA